MLVAKPKYPLAYRVGILARELVHLNILDVIAGLNLADDIEPLREALTAVEDREEYFQEKHIEPIKKMFARHERISKAFDAPNAAADYIAGYKSHRCRH